MSPRERILARLRAAPDAHAPAASAGGGHLHTAHRPGYDRDPPRDPWTAWQEALRQQRAEVQACQPGQAAVVLSQWLRHLGAARVMRPMPFPADGQSRPGVPSPPAHDRLGHALLEDAQALANDVTWSCFDQPIEAVQEALFTDTDLGLTLAQGAIADPGVVVLHSGPHQPRSLSLVPPMHLVVVWHSQLLPHVPAWIAQWPRDAQGRPQLPTNLVWISGPSKTSDIQQTLAFGAHGPQRLLVLAIDDLGGRA